MSEINPPLLQRPIVREQGIMTPDFQQWTQRVSDNLLDENIDGGSPEEVFLSSQSIDGGSP